MPKLDNQTILLACLAVTALAVLMQTLILLLIFVALRKTANSIREEAENLRASIMPIIFDTRDMLANTQATLANAQEFLGNAQTVLTRVTPRIESTTYRHRRDRPPSARADRRDANLRPGDHGQGAEAE